MVVAIAAQAVLPVLRLGLARYDGFVGIVVHPGQVVARREVADDDGIVHEYDEVLAGEAMEGGPVMLSWQDVRGAGRSAAIGYNVVIHEFAHVLDMADGVADGVPLLPADIAARGLARPAAAGVRRPSCSASSATKTPCSTPTAPQAEDEFFAVASEAFFVHPQAMQREHPGLYGMFARFYRQDPAAETAAPRGAAA